MWSSAFLLLAACGGNAGSSEDPDAGTAVDRDAASATCGNGIRDPEEQCDIAIQNGPGSCPSRCNDGMSCTKDTLQNAGTCAAVCVQAPINVCFGGDGCCGPGCVSTTDSDCVAPSSGAKDGCSWLGDYRYPKVVRTFGTNGPFIAGAYSVLTSPFGGYSSELWISNKGPAGPYFAGESHLAFGGSFEELEASSGTMIASDGGSLVAISKTQVWKVGGVVDPVAIAAGPGGTMYVVTVTSGTSTLRRRLGIAAPSSTQDTGFGQGGSVAIVVPSIPATQGMGPAITVDRLFVDGAGRIYVIGTTMRTTTNTKHAIVLRYSPTGTLDLSFEQGAYVLQDNITGVEADMDLDRQHLFLFVHRVSAFPADVVVHLTAAGFDAGYGVNGLAALPVCWWPALGPAPDGRLVVASSCGYELRVRRLLANGTLDGSYATNGVQTYPVTMFADADEIRLVGIALSASQAPHVVFNGAEHSVFDRVEGVSCKLIP